MLCDRHEPSGRLYRLSETLSDCHAERFDSVVLSRVAGPADIAIRPHQNCSSTASPYRSVNFPVGSDNSDPMASICRGILAGSRDAAVRQAPLAGPVNSVRVLSKRSIVDNRCPRAVTLSRGHLLTRTRARPDDCSASDCSVQWAALRRSKADLGARLVEHPFKTSSGASLLAVCSSPRAGAGTRRAPR